MPDKESRNTRAAHCTPVLDEDERYCDREYQLVFPFEKKSFVKDYIWVLDRDRECWKTVGWGVEGLEDDRAASPDQVIPCDEGNSACFSPQSPQSSDDGHSETEDLLSGMDGLSLGTQKRSSQLEYWFNHFCATNQVKKAEELLKDTENPQQLINYKWYGKPLLLMVCEEGHIEVVKFLLTQGPRLEATDRYGNTALLAALRYGYGQIAREVLAAGADATARNRDGETVQSLATKSERSLREMQGLDLKGSDKQSLLRQSRLSKRREELDALRGVIEQCNSRTARHEAEQQRMKLFSIYGQEQTEAFMANGGFTRDGIIFSMLRKLYGTPVANDRKTVACLVRSNALPFEVAVSGYTSGLVDGALDRVIWTRRVFELAAIVKHDLPVDSWDDAGSPGSFHACHAEKQLLAFAIWTHSTGLGVPEACEELRECEPPDLSKIPVEIFVYNKWHFICDDCYAFCGKVAQMFQMSLELFLVQDEKTAVGL